MHAASRHGTPSLMSLPKKVSSLERTCSYFTLKALQIGPYHKGSLESIFPLCYRFPVPYVMANLGPIYTGMDYLLIHTTSGTHWPSV